MFLLSISPFMWDVIIIVIILFGFITGFFMGMQSLLFVTIGNGLAIALAYACKSLILPSFINIILPICSEFNENIRFLIASNFGNAIYFIIWIISFDIWFWLFYLIFKLTIMKKYQLNHLAINSVGGAVINTFRMAIVAGYVILFAGSGLIANRSEVISNYLVNDIAKNSVMYKFYSSIYPNIPFFDIKNSDLKAINDFNNYSKIITYTVNGIENANSVTEIITFKDTFNQLQPFSDNEKAELDFIIANIKHNPSYLPQGKNAIKVIIKNHVDLDFLTINFMQPKLDMMKNIINQYLETAQFFSDNFTAIVNQKGPINTNLNPTAWNKDIKPAIEKFLTEITNGNAHSIMEIAFRGLYVPYQ